MKVNIPVRMKNPWFWVGVVSVAITAIGVDPMTFTSWAAVLDGIKAVLSNPVQLCTMALAILSVFIDPTTAGVGDSKTALGYDRPNKEKEVRIFRSYRRIRATFTQAEAETALNTLINLRVLSI